MVPEKGCWLQSICVASDRGEPYRQEEEPQPRPKCAVRVVSNEESQTDPTSKECARGGEGKRGVVKASP